MEWRPEKTKVRNNTVTIVSKLVQTVIHELKTLRGAFYRRLYLSRTDELSLVERFHQLFFDARAFNMTWRNISWMGHPILKCPMDLWLYQEIIHELRPHLIIESGTAFGGSALYLASICDLVGHGRVVTIDVEVRGERPKHPRITYLQGSSVSEKVMNQIRAEVEGQSPILVILDSDHRKEHVLAELETFSPLVTKGSYLIVEDTNLNGHPVEPDFGPGPAEAVEEFLVGHKNFTIDRTKEKLYLTFNPGGYLKKND